MTHILLIEDDSAIIDLICAVLPLEGYEVKVAQDGPTGLDMVRRFPPSLVLLDLNLPLLDGLSVCRQLRSHGDNTPILVLSARTDLLDRVTALEIGADDFLVKPFDHRELSARVRALLRRAQPGKARLVRGKLALEPSSRRVFLEEREVALTLLEFNILTALAEEPGTILTRQQILDRAWGVEFGAEERTVDSHMRNLRAKLRDAGGGALIQSVRGVGYRLVH